MCFCDSFNYFSLSSAGASSATGASAGASAGASSATEASAAEEKEEAKPAEEEPAKKAAEEVRVIALNKCPRVACPLIVDEILPVCADDDVPLGILAAGKEEGRGGEAARGGGAARQGVAGQGAAHSAQGERERLV